LYFAHEEKALSLAQMHPGRGCIVHFSYHHTTNVITFKCVTTE
jgi:hypothetical protein